MSLKVYSQSYDSTDFDKEPTSILEVAKQGVGDTIIFYFNNRYQLVRPVCADIFRKARVDNVLISYTGEFTDFYMDSTIAVKGAYSDGKKNGLFYLYFPDGQLNQFGSYIDGQKAGRWEYFYEDGNKQQVLEFRDKEIYVWEFWDESGNKLVESGNGTWHAYETSEKFMKISGEVLNGRRNGKWKKTIPTHQLTTNIEKYKDGKFVSGNLFSLVGGVERYKDKNYCSIEQTLAFENAELFQFNICFKKEKNKWEYAVYPGGNEQFYQEIRTKFDISKVNSFKGLIKVQTTIDKEGNMTNFKPVTETGLEFELIRVLQTMGTWIPTKVNGEPTIQPKLISFEIK